MGRLLRWLRFVGTPVVCARIRARPKPVLPIDRPYPAGLPVVSIRRRLFGTVVTFLSTLFLLAIPLPIAEQAPAFAAVLALPFVVLAYGALTSVVNHNTVTLGRTLEVGSGPLPWLGSSPNETARITSIEPRTQRVTRSTRAYDIIALVDGVPHVVVSRLPVAERDLRWPYWR